MINVVITPPKLNPTAIIPKILDTPIFASTRPSGFIAKLIPRGTPMIPLIRLAMARPLPNKIIFDLNFSSTNKIANNDKRDNAHKIQHIVTNDRADIFLPSEFDGQSRHIDLPSNEPHDFHNPYVAVSDSTEIFPLRKKMILSMISFE